MQPWAETESRGEPNQPTLQGQAAARIIYIPVAVYIYPCSGGSIWMAPNRLKNSPWQVVEWKSGPKFHTFVGENTHCYLDEIPSAIERLDGRINCNEDYYKNNISSNCLTAADEIAQHDNDWRCYIPNQGGSKSPMYILIGRNRGTVLCSKNWLMCSPVLILSNRRLKIRPINCTPRIITEITPSRTRFLRGFQDHVC